MRKVESMGCSSVLRASLLATSLAMSACGGDNNTAPPPATPTAAATTPTLAPTAPQGSPELPEAGEHRRFHHGGVLMLVAMSVRDLDLTADQKATIERIRTDLLAKMEPARAAGRDLSNVLADGVAAGSVDQARANAAIDKLVQQAQGLHDAAGDALKQLHDALTPAQRAALVDKLQEHWQKWKAAHGQDESEEKQHHAGHLAGLVHDLGLTQDQAQQIKTAFHDRMKATPQDDKHKDVEDHLQSFATAFKADTFDPKTLASGNAADGHMARWGATRRAVFLEVAAPVLTPDQRTKLAGQIRAAADKKPD